MKMLPKSWKRFSRETREIGKDTVGPDLFPEINAIGDRSSNITGHVHCLRHFVSTFCSCILAVPFSRRFEASVAGSCPYWYHERERELSFWCVPQRTHTVLLSFTFAPNYPVRDTWPRLCPLEMHVQRKWRTLLSTLFVLRFQPELFSERTKAWAHFAIHLPFDGILDAREKWPRDHRRRNV